MRAALLVSLAFAVALLGSALSAIPGTQPVHAVQDVQASWGQQHSTSDTYLTINGATVTARVEATIKNGSGAPMPSVALWALPGASSVAVSLDGAPLTTKLTAAILSDDDLTPALVTATLAAALKPNTQADFVLTYSVPTQNNQIVKLSAGSMESVLISQGVGSFVFVDVPTASENYFDPGCLKTLNQPKDVADAGRERWVCGDPTILALNTDDHDLQKRCANLDERCRQRSILGPYSAGMQSISDLTIRGFKEADVAMANGPVKLTLRYFKEDETWAKKQFDIAQLALPKLEQAFNFPYPNKTILMRQSHHIETLGFAGLAFRDDGEVLISSYTGGIDENVTIHELAHQWAAQNLSWPWLWEGMAEWGERTVGPSLGVKSRDWGWQKYGYTDQLATWYNGSTITNSNYWYGKSTAFWEAYEVAVGGHENMRAILGQMDDNEKLLPLDGKWFMDTGERVSGKNLDALFIQWVWNPQTAPAVLSERRTIWDQLAPIRARAASLGLVGMPVDIGINLDAWTFTNVPAQMIAVTKVMDSYVEATQLATSAGLATPNPLADHWAKEPIPRLQGIVNLEKQAANDYISAAAMVPPEAADAAGPAQLAKARDAFTAADFSQADSLAAAAVLAVKDFALSSNLIARASAKQAAFHEGWLESVGLYFADPSADLANAKASFEAGDYVAARNNARSAMDSWSGARDQGLLYLGILAAVVIVLCVVIFRFRPTHLPGRQKHPPVRFRSVAYEPPAPDDSRATSWRDWTNNP